MFGRAGRTGCPSRGHLFYSDRNLKKIEDTTLSQFISSAENCRRQTLISGMGGSGCVRPSERCCDVCTPQAITANDRLNILEIGKAMRRRKRVRVSVVSEDLTKALKEQLLAERAKYLEENPCYLSVGASFVCPDVTVDELCSQAEYIETSSDITLFGIRSELKERFFKVLSSVLPQMVHRKRHCCV